MRNPLEGLSAFIPSRAVDEYEALSSLDLLDVMDPVYGAMTVDFVFRGHGDSEWKLVPHLFREAERLGRKAVLWNEPILPGESSFEIDLLLNFFIEADRRGFEIPEGGERTISCFQSIQREGTEDFAGWLKDNRLLQAVALAQHSGVPTRLLDWTRSPHVALYFAARDHLRLRSRPEKMAVWAIQASPLSSKSIESLLPVPEKRAVWSDLNLGLIGVGGNGNPNLRAQSGELMLPYLRVLDELGKPRKAIRGEDIPGLTWAIEDLFELLVKYRTTTSSYLPFLQFKKITLSSDEVPSLLMYLDRLGINGGSAFPGLSGIADTAKERTYNRAEQPLSDFGNSEYIRRVTLSGQKLMSMAKDPQWRNFQAPDN